MYSPKIWFFMGLGGFCQVNGGFGGCGQVEGT